ncbi:MAG: hypothetical protein ACK4N5_13900 [Myxococcales bacterium]
MLHALLALQLTALSAPIAFAQPTGPSTLRLTLEAGPGEEAACNADTLGVEPSAIASRPVVRLHRELSVHVGPRFVGTARVTDVQAWEDAQGRCHLVATAAMEGRLPVLARGDVLWASAARLPSSAWHAPDRNALRAATAALQARVGPGCLREATATLRGSASGTFVGVVCGEATAIVRVRKKGEPDVVLLSSGSERLTLVDVLDPAVKKENLLVLARQGEDGRRLELWQANGARAVRLLRSGPIAAEPAAVTGL